MSLLCVLCLLEISYNCRNFNLCLYMGMFIIRLLLSVQSIVTQVAYNKQLRTSKYT